MSRSIGFVLFDDGRTLYCVFDQTRRICGRALFATRRAASKHAREGEPIEFAPPARIDQEAPVTVFSRVTKSRGTVEFRSRACYSSKWLTGAASVEDAIEESLDGPA
jgi:hypothetical protein